MSSRSAGLRYSSGIRRGARAGWWACSSQPRLQRLIHHQQRLQEPHVVPGGETRPRRRGTMIPVRSASPVQRLRLPPEPSGEGLLHALRHLVSHSPSWWGRRGRESHVAGSFPGSGLLLHDVQGDADAGGASGGAGKEEGEARPFPGVVVQEKGSPCLPGDGPGPDQPQGMGSPGGSPVRRPPAGSGGGRPPGGVLDEEADVAVPQDLVTQSQSPGPLLRDSGPGRGWHSPGGSGPPCGWASADP